MTRTRSTLIFFACLVGASPALAQGAVPTEEAAPADDEYTMLVEEGIAEFGRGNWEESLLLFSQAHELNPNARTFRGMGMAAYEARQYVRAIINLQAALSDERRALSDGQKAEVQSLIRKSERFVARMTLDIKPEGATVLVDSREPVLDQSGLLLLDRGDHEVVIRAPGHDSVVRKLVVRSGEKATFQAHLEPEGSSAGKPAPGAPDTGDGAVDVETYDDMGSAEEPDLLGVYIAGGVAVAFVGTAIATFFVASGAAQDVEDACRGNCTGPEYDDELADSGAETFQLVSTLSWVGAGAAAATAGVLYYLTLDSGSETATADALRVGFSPTGVRLSGTF